jgi:hypothetical protein
MEGKISKPVEKPIQEVPPRVEEKTVDSKREPIKIQPDIAVRLVSRKELTVALLNVSHYFLKYAKIQKHFLRIFPRSRGFPSKIYFNAVFNDKSPAQAES